MRNVLDGRIATKLVDDTIVSLSAAPLYWVTISPQEGARTIAKLVLMVPPASIE
jgi:hypothetical protein